MSLRSLVAGLALAALSALTLPGGFGAQLDPVTLHTSDTDIARANHLLRQAAGMKRAGKYELALEANLDALQTLRAARAEDHIEVARIQQTVAQLYLQLDLAQEAGPFVRASHSTFSSALPSLHIDFVRSLALLGRWQTLSGQFSEAEKTLIRAHDLVVQIMGENGPETGMVLAYLGMLYDAKGELQHAETLLKKALRALVSKGGVSLDATVTDLDVELAAASTIMAKGDYLRAAVVLGSIGERAEARYGIKHPRTADIFQAAGDLLFKIGQRKEAARYFWIAYQIRAETLGDRNLETITSVRALAETYEINNRNDAVAMLKLLDIVADVYKKTVHRESIVYATVLANQGYYQALIGEIQAATELIDAAIRLARSPALARHPLSAKVLTSASLFHAWRGHWAKALFLQEAAEQVRELNAGIVLTTGSARQRYAYMSALRDATDVTISLAAAAAPIRRARAARIALTTVLQRKGRVLDVQRESISNSGEERGKLGELKRERSSIRARLASLSVSRELRNASGPYSQEYNKLWIDLERVESNLSEAGRDDLDAMKPVTAREIQAAIPETTLLVEFVRYRPIDFTAYGTFQVAQKPERYGAFLLARRMDARFLDLGEAGEIDEQARAFLIALRNRASQDVRKRSHDLYQTVMQPVLDAGGVAKALLVAPDGLLELVPLGALVDEEGRYLLERYLLSYLTSGRDLRWLSRRAPAKGSPLIIANPAYGPLRPIDPDTPEPDYRGQRSQEIRGMSFRELSGTAEEGRELERLIRDAKLLQGKHALEGAIKATHAPVLLHLATHGFFLGETKRVEPNEVTIAFRSASRATISVPWVENGLLRSGLAFTGANALNDGENDGILTALEASDLDLVGTKLVVLSACDTGIGEQIAGEGVMGLRRAMLIAGTETLVVSLWKVSDRETSRLMTSYYCHLAAGLGRAEALREAQRKFLNSPQTRHPFFWAAFVSLGDWRPMTLPVTEGVCERTERFQ